MVEAPSQGFLFSDILLFPVDALPQPLPQFVEILFSPESSLTDVVVVAVVFAVVAVGAVVALVVVVDDE